MTVEFDDLRYRLASLASDVDALRLPGAAGIRQRAAQRQRRQVTVRVVAGVAAAAAGFAVVGQNPFDTDPPPAAAPSGSTSGPTDPSSPSVLTTPGSPDPTTPDSPTPPDKSPDQTLRQLAADPFLTDDDVDPVGTYDGFARSSTEPPDAAQLAFVCLERVYDWPADADLAASFTSENNEATLYELVRQLPDVDSAMRVITDHTILPEQCGQVSDTHQQTVGEPAVIEVDGADDALVWTVVDEPLPNDPGSEGSVNGVAMARAANIVVVVGFGAFGDPTDGGWSDYAAQTLALALERAVD